MHASQMYRDASAKPWTSRQWAPPGYASRRDLEAERKLTRPTPNGNGQEMNAERANVMSGTMGAEEEERKEVV